MTETLATHDPTTATQPAGNDRLNYYNPDLDNLIFEDVDHVNFYVTDWNRVSLRHAVIIRHYRKQDQTDLHLTENHYLDAIFRMYLERNLTRQQDQQKRTTKEVTPQEASLANRTAFIAQFRPQVEEKKQSHESSFNPRTFGPTSNYPTYAVSYEMEIEVSACTFKAVQICFRPITRDSFLCTALNSNRKPVEDPSLHPCLVLHRPETSDFDNDQCDGLGPYCMHSQMMAPHRSAHPNRVLSVAKNGWLVAFLRGSPRAFVLLEDQHLVIDDTTMAFTLLTYKRILDMKSTSRGFDQMYMGQAVLISSQLKDTESTGTSKTRILGMVVTRAVVHNEYNENAFAILGLGNAEVDYGQLANGFPIP